MLSKDEQIANLERQVRELDERYTQALVSINRLNSDTRLLLTSQEVKDNANIALKAEVARLRSQNQTQAETITRQREDIEHLSHGYRS